MNADGTDQRQLSTVHGSSADWSPLGDKILFHGEVNNGIWSINPDGTHETMLYRMGGYPAWSPDGKQIAYANLSEWCIWVMDADGGNKRKLTDHNGFLPAWSADGSQIAYEAMGEKNGGIRVVNSDA
jgi:dipeptidyl aminopeptidase/acylaminoacyl peptidase